ncbi:transcriptional regulator [Streptomyces albiflavescens]|uniref:Transcriptional regulator n=1 Tax=Streptomyces albiflavescens TaxID=1623582 RepID=A0A917YBI3_9ACTN|nr:helix-turn-helix transcriptional regulator [Streptomyces albiflavescens]GGN85220.1 transcriptional regulator [Streptomyces albiflavescens]
MAGDEFAELLRELKERSGLSYGVLGKRLHVSASTLHRYVNGDAVPTDYAPVERFARLCRATPEELVELHRRWVRADVLRGRKGVEIPAAETSAAETPAVESSAAETSAVQSPAAETSAAQAPNAGAPDAVWEPGPDPEAAGGGRRRTVVLAGAAVAAAVVSAALVVNLVPGKGGNGRVKGTSVGAAASHTPSPSDAGASSSAKPPSPSVSASRSGSPEASASRGGGAAVRDGDAGDMATEEGATAPTVATNPYKWDGPCSQHYLVNRKAAQVPPPPTESDARGWVNALGGVPGGEQMVALTVQGTGKATVVLEALHVRVVGKSAPLAWNDYAMGVGCGGGVETASFHVDLDAGRPAATPKAGQRDFPYKVSESDPEVFYVFADALAHDVSWYLELDWSSGNRHGTVRIDDKGKTFRTSGNAGRPAYDYPLGGSEWETAPAG